MAEEIGVPEAANLLGVHSSRVRHLIRDGRLSARKLGRDWVLVRSAVEAFGQQPRYAGRPRLVDVLARERPEKRCEFCGREDAKLCCEVHPIVICSRCFSLVTERILLPTLGLPKVAEAGDSA